MPELTILIPCLNEAHCLPALLDRLEQVVIAGDLDVETIVLDDASEDDTIGTARALQRCHRALDIRIVHRLEPRRGYGTLIRYGMAHARGRYCLFMAADGAHPIEMLPQYLAAAREGAHLVQCSRHERPEDSEPIPANIRLYQTLYRNAVRWLLGWDIRDPTCSFKLVDRVFVQALGMHSAGLSLIPEIPFKVYLSGGKIVFVPGRQEFRERGISQFRFTREASAYGFVLARAWLHRAGIQSWF